MPTEMKTRQARSERFRRSMCPSPNTVEAIPVEATQGLPEVESLPLFKYKAAAKFGVDQPVDLMYYPPRVNPRQCDYAVNPADWAPKKRSAKFLGRDDDRGAPQGANTVEAILGAGIEDHECHECGKRGAECVGSKCIVKFKDRMAAQEMKSLEIRETNDMGVGVFAKCAIKKGVILCEYTGRLYPLDHSTPTNGDYTWHVAGVCRVDSLVYGNIGRFANHHCTEYNCDSLELMYGRRKVLCYQVRRDIAEGDQLFVNYGPQYWTPQKPCRCTAFDFAHSLGPKGRVHVAPTKKMAWEAAKKKQAADKLEKEKSRR